MSRHSKWSKVKQYKGAIDAKRASIFTQMARGITMAAKEKGGDPSMNFKLRMAIDRARAANMPKDNIDRAIKKGTGELEAEVIEELVYEGYGPGGAAVLVECLTDNRNRTVGEIKHIFSKNGGTFGATNSVAWMFDRKAVARVPTESLSGKDLDEVELQMVDAGADDVRREPDELAAVAPIESLQSLKENLEKAGFTVDSAEIEYLAKDPVPLNPEEHEGLEELLEAFEDNEDVKAVYTNVKL